VSQVLIAFGSNLGDRLRHLQAAADALSSVIHWQRLSHVYSTDPMYVTDQPAFLNAAGLGYTSRDPVQLLAELKRTEQALGRQERERFGPREIDIDLIDYENAVIHTEQLIVPHPRFAERPFVLRPLQDVAPDWKLGDFSVRQWNETTDHAFGSVIKVEDAVLSLPSR